MKLIAQVKLQTSPEQHQLLLDTLEQTGAACNYLSEHAWEKRVFKQYDLHHACYYAVRERFGLSAQMTVRAEAKVADAYKLDRECRRVFKKHGSIAYDERILSWKMASQSVSIWTMEGRQQIPFWAGERQLELLENHQGEADLIYRQGGWYLHQVCEVAEAEACDASGWLGVDLGIVNLAVTSDCEFHTGDVIESRRR